MPTVMNDPPREVEKKMTLFAEHGGKLFPSIGGEDREFVDEWIEHWRANRDAAFATFTDGDGEEWTLYPVILPQSLDETIRFATADEVLAEPWRFWRAGRLCRERRLLRTTGEQKVKVLESRNGVERESIGTRRVETAHVIFDESRFTRGQTLDRAIAEAIEQAKSLADQCFVVRFDGWPAIADEKLAPFLNATSTGSSTSEGEPQTPVAEPKPRRSDAELDALAARGEWPDDEHEAIRNWHSGEIPATDEAGRVIELPLSIGELTNSILSRTRGWPRNCGGVLFAVRNQQPVFLTCVDSLFSWLHTFGQVDWATGRKFVTQNSSTLT